MTTALIGVEEVSGSVKQGASDVIVRHFDKRSFQHSRNGDVIFGGIFGDRSSMVVIQTTFEMITANTSRRDS